MIVIDTSALIAILRLEPEASAFLRVIVSARACLMSGLNLLEASVVLAGPDTGEVSFSPPDDFVKAANIQIVPFDSEQVEIARVAFLRFGKGRHQAGLNLGDCAAYALARSRKLPLLFKGDDFSKTDVMPATLP